MPIYHITTTELPGFLLWIKIHKGMDPSAIASPTGFATLWQQYLQHIDDAAIDSDSNEYREKFGRNTGVPVKD